MNNELSLLYIEDDPEILENVTFLLNRFVKEVYSAKDGEEALELYEKHNPDILVADINIPKIDGFEVASKIRKKNSAIPIVIITAYDEEYHLQKAKELNVSAYIKKPFTLQEFKDAINKVIEAM